MLNFLPLFRSHFQCFWFVFSAKRNDLINSEIRGTPRIQPPLESVKNGAGLEALLLTRVNPCPLLSLCWPLENSLYRILFHSLESVKYFYEVNSKNFWMLINVPIHEPLKEQQNSIFMFNTLRTFHLKCIFFSFLFFILYIFTQSIHGPILNLEGVKLYYKWLIAFTRLQVLLQKRSPLQSEKRSTRWQKQFINMGWNIYVSRRYIDKELPIPCIAFIFHFKTEIQDCFIQNTGSLH